MSIEFSDYQGKPIVRKAYEVKPGDRIQDVGDCHYRLTNASGEVLFSAQEKVKAGDFIVYLNDTDVYHCSRQVFEERNWLDDKDYVYRQYEEINRSHQALKEWAEQPVNAEQIEFVEREQMHEALELYPAKIMGLGGALVEMEQRVNQWKQQNTSSAKH